MNPKIPWSIKSVVAFAAASTALYAVNLHAQPSITTQPVSQLGVFGSNVTFSVTVAGTGPFTYQWQFNGTNLPQGLITTVAGGGGSTNNGIPATSASLLGPAGVAFDAAGNFYIAESGVHYGYGHLRLVDTNGVINTTPTPVTNWYWLGPVSVALGPDGGWYVAGSAPGSVGTVFRVGTNGAMTRVAGGGSGGDGGAATNASLSTVEGITLDAAGNLFIADTGNNRIRRVDAITGVISTIAGNGGPGYSGDGGAATNASLYSPYGVALDTAQVLYIADAGNYRIRRVNANGLITTVAGVGKGQGGGDGGAATNAVLSDPQSVAPDGNGGFYVADTGHNRIRRVDADGFIATVAGNDLAGYSGDGGAATNAQLSSPYGAGVDAAGNLYIADYQNNRVRKVLAYAGYQTLRLRNLATNNAGSYSVVVTSPSGSVTSNPALLTLGFVPSITRQPTNQVLPAGSNTTFSVTAAGTEPLSYRWYFNGTAMASGSNAVLSLTNLATTDSGSYFVAVASPFGTVTSSLAVLTVGYPPSIGTPPATQTVLAGSSASLSVTMAGTGPFIYRWRRNGTNLPNDIITTIAGGGTNRYGDGSPATNLLIYPSGLTLDPLGNLYIGDGDRVRKLGTNGTIRTVIGGGLGPDLSMATNTWLSGAAGVSLDSAGALYTADAAGEIVYKVTPAGKITTVAGTGSAGYSGDGGAATNASLYRPMGVAIDPAGAVYIGDSMSHRVRKVATNGIISTVAGNGTTAYTGDGGPATNTGLFLPEGLVLDAQGKLNIAAFGSGRVCKLDGSGNITTLAGGGWNLADDWVTNAFLVAPRELAFDGFGNLYIAEVGFNRIRKLDTLGRLTTVAGIGTNACGYFGDGGPATSARLCSPSGVAADPSGNLFISDGGNNRVRTVPYGGYPTLNLNQVAARDSGDYTVVVTSPYGSVTSSAALFTVVTPLVMSCRQNSDGAITLNFASLPNTTNRVWTTTNLAPPVIWQPVFTNTAVGADGTWQFTDTNSIACPARFYRFSIP